MERHASEEQIEGFYLPSLSNRTLVYKGLLVAHQLPTFYRDLRDPQFETALAVFHQRYSTNTFPNWYLSQPFRMLAHNGEINTLNGNVNWTRARESGLESEVWGDRVKELAPLVQSGGSRLVEPRQRARGDHNVRPGYPPRFHDAHPRGVGEHAQHAER